MKHAGFRMLLFGLESANQSTLDRLNKGIDINKVKQELAWCRKAGLYPHITVMFGYPWETEEEACNTYRFVRELLRKGLAYTMQVSAVTPYPGTKLYNEFTPPTFEMPKNKWVENFKNQESIIPDYKCNLNNLFKTLPLNKLIENDFHSKLDFINMSDNSIKGGSTLALKRLRDFEADINNYHQWRDLPAYNKTSNLSTALR